ncbi:MAG: EFR1 family ferrodoxin [Clostridiales bacterium]|nr:EFR1 family ferrodoxin [Clostridiales bacterium]
MRVKTVWAVYFSATGTTKKVVHEIADVVAKQWGVDREDFDFTLPVPRKASKSFDPNDLVIFGTPVYAGRVPNVLLKELALFQGNGAAAVPVVLFGNRNYDDALIELRDILEKDGFHTVAAGAFIGEHAFSYTLAAGRPDAKDLEKAYEFAHKVAEKLDLITDFNDTLPIFVKGTPAPYSGYYTPRDRNGMAVDIRKVKPLTNGRCDCCGICVDVCPMGSISREDVSQFTGICIKCGACIKKCPQHAKYYEDERYLYHQRELEEGLKRRAEPELFL